MTDALPENSGKCPVAYALDLIGDRWTLLIVRDMLFRGKTSFVEFTRSHEKISTNILTNRLQRLEASGIVTKSRAPGNAKVFVYGLTEKGLDLIPVLLEMIAWSAAHDGPLDEGQPLVAGAPDNLLDWMRHDRAYLIREIRAKAMTAR